MAAMEVIKSKTFSFFYKSSKKILVEKIGELKFVCQFIHSSES